MSITKCLNLLVLNSHYLQLNLAISVSNCQITNVCYSQLVHEQLALQVPQRKERANATHTEATHWLIVTSTIILKNFMLLKRDPQKQVGMKKTNIDQLVINLTISHACTAKFK